MRKLPIYLLVETSILMAGEPIDTINYSIQTLIKRLSEDPYHVETSYISVITFDSSARKLIPLTEIVGNMQIPIIQVTNKRKADLWKALILLDEIMDSEVVTTTPLNKGDWKPKIVVMTNGNLNFDLNKIDRIFKRPNFANIYICLIGDNKNSKLFSQISLETIKLPERIDYLLRKFNWVTSDP